MRLKYLRNGFDLPLEWYHVVKGEFLYSALTAWLTCRMVIEKAVTIEFSIIYEKIRLAESETK